MKFSPSLKDMSRVLAAAWLASSVTLSWFPAFAISENGQRTVAAEEFQAWKNMIGARDGSISLSGRVHKGYYRAYACASSKAATAVVAAVAATKKAKGTVRAQSQQLKSQLGKNRCQPAKGKYKILAKGREVEINHGFEASENWTVLEVSDSKGKRLALVFDGSPYSIND